MNGIPISNGNPMESSVGFSRAVRIGPRIPLGGAAPLDTIMRVSRLVNPDWLVEIEADAVVSARTAVETAGSGQARQACNGDPDTNGARLSPNTIVIADPRGLKAKRSNLFVVFHVPEDCFAVYALRVLRSFMPRGYRNDMLDLATFDPDTSLPESRGLVNEGGSI